MSWHVSQGVDSSSKRMRPRLGSLQASECQASNSILVMALEYFSLSKKSIKYFKLGLKFGNDGRQKKLYVKIKNRIKLS